MQKKKTEKMIAYCFTKHLKTMTEEDLRMLDAVHIAFGLIHEGEVTWKGKTASRLFSHMKEINPELKIVLSIGGWGADGFSQAAMSSGSREKLASSAVRLVEQYGFDGLDIDWEYPCIGVGGISCDLRDKENYTLLLAKLREKLDGYGGKTLSIAAGGDEYFLHSTNMGEAARYLDYIQLMNYDLRGGFQTVTGHHANLYTGYGDLAMASTDKLVRQFARAGVPMEKLVVGIAFYGRQWKGVKDAKGGNGLGRMARTTGSSFLNFDEVEKLLAAKNTRFQKYWDEQAQAAWLFDGSTFISYEDERAIAGKAQYAKQNHLYGVMYWEYALDKEHTLTQLLKEQLA